ncbi:MAG: type II/IV secretion system ATPase subunit [Dehalococcoidia bacterium]
MPYLRFPFPDTGQAEQAHNESRCPICTALSPELKEQAQQYHHLFRYLHMVPIDEFGVPQYHEKLERKMGDIEQPNIIYPVGDATFAHIFPDPQDARNYYIPVEPIVGGNYGPLMEVVEDRLVDVVHKLSQPSTPEEQKELLLEALNRIAATKRGNGKVRSINGTKDKSGGRSLLKFPNSGRLKLTQDELEAIRYLLLRDKVYMGILQPLILDTNIEDITCSGLGPIFVEHKVFKALKSAIVFDEDEDLDSFLRRISERINKPVTYRRPIVDATLPDGSRINIVFGAEVSKRGSNFTIRKFATTPLSVLDIAEGGGLNYHMIAYLSIVIEEGMNLFVSGETASGKTTLLNAITTFLTPNAKIVTIEDTPELQIPHPNWTREVIRGAAEEGAGVSMFDLLKAALRQRPNAILVGEIRGEEGNIAFQAMQTGHTVMATFHAASVEKLIQRITGNPINVPKTYMDNLNVVVIISAVKLPNGKTGRRILSVNELFGYDPVTDSFAFAEVFHWDPVTDTFEFTGYMNSYILENKIAVKRGIPANQRRVMYQEVERRAKALEKLHQSGVKDFYELYQVLAKARRQGLF